jgi:dTDP-4-dehydrorhamnose reductase
VLREEMTKKTRYLIVGADSRIGGALWKKLEAEGSEVSGTSRRRPTPQGQVYLDLASDPTEWTLPKTADVVFLCAAISALRACQEDPIRSRLVNLTNTVLLAEKMHEAGAIVVFLSTNRVYDGTVPYRQSTDEPCPTTEYGRQKAETERQLLALGERVVVVRLSKVLAPGESLFYQWREALERGKTIHPFSNMATAAISLDFAVQALCRAAASGKSGIFQVSADREVTYAQAAERLAAQLGADPKLVRPKELNDELFQSNEPPCHAALDCSRLKMELGLEPPDVWQAIDLASGISRS